MGTESSPRERARSSPIGLARLVTAEGTHYVAQAVHRYLSTVYMKMVAAATNPKDASLEKWRRVIIALPPRMGKSDIFSAYGPAWFEGLFPHLNAAVITYEATFSEGFGRKARNILETYGPQIFGVTVDPRNAASDWWATVDARNLRRTKGGTLRAFGIGGPAMGKGFNIMSIDDPIKNAQEALSKTTRDGHYDWFQTTAKTRLEPGAVVSVSMQRWHEDDLAGRLMREEGTIYNGGAWNPIIMPLRAEPLTRIHIPGLVGTLPDLLGRANGEYLWPGRYTEAELAEKERTTLAFWWAAQYQQRPALPEGALFTRDKFRYYDDTGRGYNLRLQQHTPEFVPDTQFKFKFIDVDLAASLKEKADFTVFALWGVTYSGRLMLLDLIRKKMEGPEQEEVLETFYHTNKPVSAVWIESVQYQLTMVQKMRRRGMPAKEFNPKDHGNKYARALFASARFEGENILFPTPGPGARWMNDFEDELLSYPWSGGHDDQVDVLSMASIVAGGGDQLTGDSIKVIGGGESGGGGWTRVSG
jgi:predicted phage terminase large subunit-like protein